MTAQIAADLRQFDVIISWLKGQEHNRTQVWSRLWGDSRSYDAFWQHQAVDLIARLSGQPADEVIATLRAAADEAEATP